MLRPGVHSREAVEAILSAAAILAEHAALYATTPADPSRLALVGQRGNPRRTRPAGDGSAPLPERALASGQIEPTPLPTDATAIALPIKLGQDTVAVLHLDRGDGPAFSSAELAAARALTTVAGPLVRLDQLHLASQELVVQEERNRIAREIHDGVSQNLALLMLKMEIISRLADSDPPRMRVELRKVMSILETSVQELRRSIYTLRSPDLARLGFVPALKRLAHDFAEQTNVDLTFSAPLDLTLPAETQSALFGVVQERLDAVGKAGTATKVTLKLEAAREQLLIHMVDNGQQAPPLPMEDGTPSPQWKEKLQERVRPFGGTVRVLSHPPVTKVQVRIPCL